MIKFLKKIFGREVTYSIEFLPEMRKNENKGGVVGNTERRKKFENEILPMIFRMRAYGLQYKDIAKRINEYRFLSQRGKKWTESSIRHTLLNYKHNYNVLVEKI